jgi:hypothetical protein
MSRHRVRIYFMASALNGIALAVSHTASAAPCCSAGSALPALVTNDDRGQISVMNSYSDTVMDAPDSGVPMIRSDRNADQNWMTRVSGATRVRESWQFGAGITLINRSTRVSGRDYRDAGLGDSDFSIAYEVLPEWTYSDWKPRGWLYLQTVLPTGQGIQDPRLAGPASVRGQGVFQSVVGVVLTKSWSHWDVFVVPEFRRLYGRSFGSSGVSLSGTWGAGIQLGGGYSFSSWRVGFRTQPVFQGNREVFSFGTRSIAPSKQVWNSGLDVSYLVNTDWMVAASYSDQTLLGPARNTTLERGFGILVSRKWEP